MEEPVVTFGEGGCWPSHRDELLDVAIGGHSLSLLAVGHGVRVIGTEEPTVTFGEGGCWLARRDELLDAATEGHSASLLTIGQGVWVSRTEEHAMTFGEGEHWLIGADELRVPMMDVTTVGYFMRESINGARSHRFLLTIESARLSST
jgi:hypothetical protein